MTNSDPSPATSTLPRRLVWIQRLTFVFGLVLLVGMLAWETIPYAPSPLHRTGTELKFGVAYLFVTAGLSFLSSLVVFYNPKFAGRLLCVGAALACILDVRYLFSNRFVHYVTPPVNLDAVFTSIFLPGVMLLLGLLLKYCRTTRADSTFIERNKILFAIRDILIGSLVVGLALAHYQLAKVPDEARSILMMDVTGHVPARFGTHRVSKSKQDIPVELDSRYLDRTRAREDTISILQDQFSIGLRFDKGQDTSEGHSAHYTAFVVTPERLPSEQLSLATPPPPKRRIVDELQVGLLSILEREHFEIVKITDWPGEEFSKRNTRGFSILYRTDKQEGLIQAAELGKEVSVYLEEHPRTHWLSIYADRYRTPRYRDWEAIKSNRLINQ